MMRQCHGRTKNWARCKKRGDWKFFCSEHKRQPLKWTRNLIFLLAAVVGIFSYLENRVKSQITPNIVCDINYADKSNPTLMLFNNGPVKIVSLSVDYIQGIYIHDLKYMLFREPRPIPKWEWIKKHEFLTYGEEYLPLAMIWPKINGKEGLAINVFWIFLKYYRETDMKKIEKTIILYADKTEIYGQADFMNHPTYNQIYPLIDDLSQKGLGSKYSEKDRQELLRKIDFGKYIKED